MKSAYTYSCMNFCRHKKKNYRKASKKYKFKNIPWVPE